MSQEIDSGKIIKEWAKHIDAIPILKHNLTQQKLPGGCKICAAATEFFIHINETLQETLENPGMHQQDKNTFDHIIDIYNSWHTVAMLGAASIAEEGHQQLIESGMQLPLLCAARPEDENTN
jgi:translation initiation factor RLI1